MKFKCKDHDRWADLYLLTALRVNSKYTYSWLKRLTQHGDPQVREGHGGEEDGGWLLQGGAGDEGHQHQDVGEEGDRDDQREHESWHSHNSGHWSPAGHFLGFFDIETMNT